ncbi:hypothetical protein A3K86_16925 [Photobacterium jeanii]|uniref:GIY-YIG domain-containing protein n=1 Tax=Photobacterium jeanii TaxID=858640 RepID=A0A178K8Q4_9GAMM|nr:GIY-YIG nuclease family protein [Photobacterium jeanii]OAN13335.1 hypothetical protein A3K86_16925 [Photobacterium jeanii]PST90334.1 hypothetical protein C9I91_06725 [Photobacterium jeanii]
MFYLYHIHQKAKPGIYADGYIGITDDVNRRREEHFSKLRRGEHPNFMLQDAYDDYELEFTIVTEAKEREIVASLEESLRPEANMAWNLKKGGEGSSVEDLLERQSPDTPHSSNKYKTTKRLSEEERHELQKEKHRRWMEDSRRKMQLADAKEKREEEKHQAWMKEQERKSQHHNKKIRELDKKIALEDEKYRKQSTQFDAKSIGITLFVLWVIISIFMHG